MEASPKRGRKHWAKRCTLTYGEEAADRTRDLPLVATSSQKDKDLADLQSFFKGSSDAHPSSQVEEEASMKAAAVAVGCALRLENSALARRRAKEDSDAINHADGCQVEKQAAGFPTSPGLPGLPPKCGTCPAGLNSWAKSAQLYASAPPKPSADRETPDLPFLHHAQKLHMPITEEEIAAASSPAPLRLNDLPRVVTRRTSERPGSSHYDYFARRLPDESPKRRTVLQHRVASERPSRGVATPRVGVLSPLTSRRPSTTGASRDASPSGHATGKDARPGTPPTPNET